MLQLLQLTNNEMITKTWKQMLKFQKLQEETQILLELSKLEQQRRLSLWLCRILQTIRKFRHQLNNILPEMLLQRC